MKSTWKALLKTASWRLVGAADTFAIAYLLTGHGTAAMSLVGLEVVTKSVWYFLHEKVWG